MRLHIGCGKRQLEGYVHIDGANYPHIAHNDVNKLPFEDNSVDEIYTAHLISYFSYVEIQAVFREWYRVLKPEGILRIATPDFKAITTLYSQGESLMVFLGLIYGNMDMNGTTISHKTIWDFDSLNFMLVASKFRNVIPYSAKQFLPSGYDDHSLAHYPTDLEAIETGIFKDSQTLVSLNIQCRK